MIANIDYASTFRRVTCTTTPFALTVRFYWTTFGAEQSPSESFIVFLAAPLRSSIGEVVDDNCGNLVAFQVRDRAAEIYRRHLQDRWAFFALKGAIEPMEPGLFNAVDLPLGECDLPQLNSEANGLTPIGIPETANV